MYGHADHHFSPYNPYIQQRKSILSKEDHLDERRHSIHFPSSPPPETTQMKFAFSSPIQNSSSTWAEPVGSNGKYTHIYIYLLLYSLFY